MLGFFKRDKNNIAKEGDDYTVDSKELGVEAEGESTGKEVKTSLHFHPLLNVGEEEKYYYRFLNNELPLLKENQISLSGIELKVDHGRVMVKAFIRNSLAQGIQFKEPIPLSLLGPDGELLARQVFDLSSLGEMPAESSNPWLFVFEKENVLKQEIPQSDWKLAFEVKKTKDPHALDLEESWEKSLADSDKEKLENLVSQMTPPKPGEINFMGIQAQVDNEGRLHTTVLIRNGSNNKIEFEQIPLHVTDASDEVVAKGIFKVQNLQVKANTSKPWTFIFPKELILKSVNEIDLSRWTAAPPAPKKS